MEERWQQQAAGVTIGASGGYTGITTGMATGMGVATVDAKDQALMRLSIELIEARSKMGHAKHRAATCERERDELAEKLGEATAENRRLGARLAGVIEMLREQKNEKLGEAIWLLEKIEMTWSAEQRPVAMAEEVEAEYIPF